MLGWVPVVPLEDGFWARADLLRSRVLAAGFKVRVADALIAQACIDHDLWLITHDRDFRHFVHGGLRLV